MLPLGGKEPDPDEGELSDKVHTNIDMDLFACIHLQKLPQGKSTPQ